MGKTKQISVGLENKPGQLACVCRCLAARKINIIALSVAETTEQGVLRLVVDKPAEAIRALSESSLPFTATDVLLLELPNKVGVMAEAAEKLSQKKINVNFVYGSTGPGRGGKTFVVLGTPNLAAAQKALAAK